MATISGGRAAPSGDISGVEMNASHPYTCNTCQVAFRNSDLQRAHMRNDWHRYNLQRRVASLPPISSEVFTEKVIQARAETSARADKAGFERACDTCQKTYYSENSFRNHVSSAKHRARVAALASRSNAKIDDEASSMTFSLGEPAADSAVDSDAEEEFNEVVEGLKSTGLHDSTSPVKRPSNPHLSAEAQHKADHPVSQTSSEEASSAATPSAPTPTAAAPSLKTCLFCNYESPTPPLNVTHMERIHGMFLPEKQYLVDIEGLLGYLQEQVFALNECLTCGKVKANVYAVQTHMRDKSHCQIPYTTEAEQLDIGEFYDFRSTYSDGEGEWEDDEDDDEEQQNGGVKLGAKRESKVTGEDGDKVVEDETWETDSDASSLDSNDLHAVPADQHYHQYDRLGKHPHHSRSIPRAHHQADGWHAHAHKKPYAVFHDDYELHLPSGKSVGHRSLNRYFRQNLYNHPTPEERAERLAIQEAEKENEMDIDDPERPSRDEAARGRALVTRDMRGLGVTTLDDERTRGLVTKGKKQEWSNQKSKGMLQTRLAIKEKAPHPATYLR
ncbi:C2H2 type zinc-finger-domain-containing protein [Chaetomidium leptoderma]|uniref:C2H2 type zinc-finger-domain-containing protein n=1 Tax=Chaetomidium leptoderma TaxID=669021 RepID=A0AAN6VNE1_9PEZI|nr:C2H2 type zinc-finger-domain-containing protein [Chaetomidium leptoderma]